MKAGAMVTSTNSGMAFRTWPDSEGYWLWPENPALDGILEHGHRLLGQYVGLLSIVLVVWVFHRDQRPFMKRSVALLLGLVILQGLLGGYRVLLDAQIPFAFAIVHGILAHVVLALAAYVAFGVSMAWVSRSIEPAAKVRTMRKLASLSMLLVFLQVVLGVVFRHTENPYAKWIHVGFALFVSLAILIAIGYSMGNFNSVPGFGRMNRISLALLVLQVLVGFVTLVVRAPKAAANTESLGRAAIQSAHVILGASLFLLATILVARSYRNLVPRAEG
jgi:cytochrome c oxidase assembly protein subunit 15